MSPKPPAFLEPGVAYRPRLELPAAEALKGDFWPPSPHRPVSYDDPRFATARLPAVPPAGVYPRVCHTPETIDAIRRTLAMGDRAPKAFRVLWQRLCRRGGAFVALVRGDGKAGRALADELVGRMARLGPKLDRLDALPDADNLWSAERSTLASGDPDAPLEIWDLLELDYLAPFMTAEEVGTAQGLLLRLTSNRVTNFMKLPDHFMINNHEGFGLEFVRQLLLVEGLPGFDARVYALAAKKARAMLDWYLSPAGMCYESIKGWLNVSAFVALGMRQRDLLRHGHLRAKMHFFLHALRFEDGRYRIRDEMRASAFHVIWMMRHFHPEDEAIAFLHRATFDTHDFLTDPEAPWPDPVGIAPELLLLYAEDPEGKAPAAVPGNPGNVWHDGDRGYLFARNTWEPRDLHLGFVCKQDFYYGGHEGSENNRLTLWKDGVNWIRDVHMLGTKQSFLQNMLTIDGRGCEWPPAPGVWLGASWGEAGALAAGDGRIGFSHTKISQVHPLDSESLRAGYFAPFAEANFDLSRDMQVAFHPGTVAWNDGYAHAEYGPWHGETRLVEQYRAHFPVASAFRSVLLARGRHPWVLTVDDARVDDGRHLYEWNITLPRGARLLRSQLPEIEHQATGPGSMEGSELLLGLEGEYGGEIPPGTPVFLVKILARNGDYGFPVPRVECLGEETTVVIPAPAVTADIKVLLYPHRQGDPLPRIEWLTDKSGVTVITGDEVRHVRFGLGEAGRTLLKLTGGEGGDLIPQVAPARPRIRSSFGTWDPAEDRHTRRDGRIPKWQLGRGLSVTLENPSKSGVIVYTLDGSEPGKDSARYEGRLHLTRSCRLRARVWDPQWGFGPDLGGETMADFTADPPSLPLEEEPTGVPGHFAVRCCEIKTVLWNDRGFFQADKIMAPDLSRHVPVSTLLTDPASLPSPAPKSPLAEQAKMFFKLEGYLRVESEGLCDFAVLSCGPVELSVGGRKVIEETGVFHQEHRERRGEAFLAAGWHRVEGYVCDPLYWNLSSLGPMPFHFKWARRGEPLALPAPSHFCSGSGVSLERVKAPRPLKPAVVTESLARGMERYSFERRGVGRGPEFFDLSAKTPYRREKVLAFETQPFAHGLASYRGFFKAPETGTYRFETARRRSRRSFLGSPASSFQHRISVSGQPVAARGIPNVFLSGEVALEAGWHTVQVDMGPGDPGFALVFSDGTRHDLERLLHCPEGPLEPMAPALLVSADFTRAATEGDRRFAGPGGALWFGHDNDWVEEDGRWHLEALSRIKTRPFLKPWVDVNVQRNPPPCGFRAHHLALNGHAISVFLEVRTKGHHGELFSKRGYTAFGKGYRTVALAVEGEGLSPDTGPVIPGAIQAGRWHQVLFSCDATATEIWVDGARIHHGPGAGEIHTDSLDFITGGAVDVRRVALWDGAVFGVEAAKWAFWESR